jgi:hypothetical protein
MKFLFLCIIIALDLVATTSSAQQAVNWGAKSALLDLGMTEQQVMNTVGYRPNKVEVQTCGQQTANRAWTCKIHTYGLQLSNLTVFFSQSPDDGTWRASGWKVIGW